MHEHCFWVAHHNLPGPSKCEGPRQFSSDELDPPPTNFVMGAQMGTNGGNALSVLGTNILAATIWNMDGAPVTNGVSIADLLCTNGVLRTPAAFEIRWKNTTGLDPEADTDGDGLTDWAEIFQLRTNQNHADTDGDGISDNVELMMGTDPFDADEDGDGVPDGTSTAAWADNALWASNASESAYSIAITLNSAIPAGASASLMVGSLCIPLRSPGSWTLGLVPGELYPYRLNVGGNVPVSLSIGPGGDAPPMRGSMNAMSIALWVDGMGGTFDGWSLGGSGNMAIPTLNVTWDDPDDGSHEGISGVCLHGGSEAVFTPAILPGIVHGEWMLNNLDERNGQLVLSVPYEGVVYQGSAVLLSDNIRFGVLQTAVSAHQCDSSYSYPYCSVCGHYQPDDFSLSVCSPLTLKHDDETSICLFHPNSPGTTIQNRTIQIRRKTNPETAWLTLGTESALNSWTAKIAGTFELRGRGVVDGVEVFTPIVEVEVRFPSYNDIIGDSAVSQAMESAWAQTLNDCKSVPNERHELGFWIRLDTRTDTYILVPLLVGRYVGPSDGASLTVYPKPSDSPTDPLPTDSGATYVVGLFHTHTPRTYIPNPSTGRLVGPSDEDASITSTEHVVGIVRDYIGVPTNYSTTNVLFNGHSINAPSMLYPIPPDRRPTP